MARGRKNMEATRLVDVVRFVPFIGSPSTMPVERARFELTREDALRDELIAAGQSVSPRAPEIQWSTKTTWRMTTREYERWMRPVALAKALAGEGWPCRCGFVAATEDGLDDHIAYMAQMGIPELHRPERAS